MLPLGFDALGGQFRGVCTDRVGVGATTTRSPSSAIRTTAAIFRDGRAQRGSGAPNIN